MELRNFRDEDGIYIELLSLNLSYVYEGLLEGSPSGAHEVFRKNIERELTTAKALYFVGFTEPEAHVQKRWADSKSWPPHELIEVRCRSKWVPLGQHPHGHTFLKVKWYQDKGDPFAYLANVLRRISWKEHARYVALVD